MGNPRTGQSPGPLWASAHNSRGVSDRWKGTVRSAGFTRKNCGPLMSLGVIARAAAAGLDNADDLLGCGHDKNYGERFRCATWSRRGDSPTRQATMAATSMTAYSTTRQPWTRRSQLATSLCDPLTACGNRS
jgi:hypothetical protein